MSLVYDSFNDVYAFKTAIQNRPDNGKASDHSRTNSDDFSGMPYDTALTALTDGLPDVSNNLKRELNRFKAVVSGQITQRRPINYYNGHSPNVPAAIIGLPKSMRKVTKQPSKVKTVTIYYNACANCGHKADTLNKSGATVLQLVYWLELNGYRAKVILLPFLAREGDEHALCKILLKEYKQPLDILKLSFSITSVSMFRRLGFRWIETVPGLQRSGWAFGYGQPLDNDYTNEKILELLQKTGENTENAYYMSVRDCKKAKFDAVELAKQLGIKVG